MNCKNLIFKSKSCGSMGNDLGCFQNYLDNNGTINETTI